jgi:hypothetical protein
MIFKKLSILMGVGLMTYLSTLGQTNLVQTQAALTAPTSYDHAYKYDATYGGFLAFQGPTSQGSAVHYTRTGTSPFNYSYVGDGDGKWPFDITMTFNKSNIAWMLGPTASDYEPDDTKIGSDNTVGSILDKWKIKFENQTKNNYRLYLDRSSSPASGYTFAKFDGTIYGGVFNAILLSGSGNLNTIYLPSYTTLEWYIETTATTQYIDAWYLQNMGVNEAYDVGYDEGFDAGELVGYEDGLNNNPNILLSGFQAMVGILVNFALMVLNLSVFGVSLLDIFAIMALLVGVIWILKLVRG